MQTIAQETLARIKINIDNGNWKDAVDIIAEGYLEFEDIIEHFIYVDTSYRADIVPLLKTAVKYNIVKINYKD